MTLEACDEHQTNSMQVHGWRGQLQPAGQRVGWLPVLMQPQRPGLAACVGLRLFQGGRTQVAGCISKSVAQKLVKSAGGLWWLWEPLLSLVAKAAGITCRAGHGNRLFLLCLTLMAPALLCSSPALYMSAFLGFSGQGD